MEVPPHTFNEPNVASWYEKAKGVQARAQIFVPTMEEGEGVGSCQSCYAAEGLGIDQGLCYLNRASCGLGSTQ